MDAQRKYAYRWLLRSGMMQLRSIGRRLDQRQARLLADVADWLQTLAAFSAVDFAQFNEEWFWNDHRVLLARHPDGALEHYRDEFEHLTRAPAGVGAPLD